MKLKHIYIFEIIAGKLGIYMPFYSEDVTMFEAERIGWYIDEFAANGGKLTCAAQNELNWIIFR